MQATEALCHLCVTNIKKTFCNIWFFCKNQACANCTGWNATTVIWLLWGVTFNAVVAVGVVSLLLFRLPLAILWFLISLENFYLVEKTKQRKFREKIRRFRNRENMWWAWPFVVTSKSNKASTWFWSVGRVLMSFSADICRKVPCSFLKLQKEIQWLILNQINNFNIRYPVEPCIT